MSLLFSAANDSLFKAATPGIVTKNFSLCLWVRNTNAGGGASTILIVDDTGGTGAMTRFNMDNTTAGQLDVTTPNTTATTLLASMTNNAWYFLALTANGNNYIAYVSPAGGGTLTATNITDTTSFTSYRQITIGDDEPNGGAPFTGNIQNVMVWNNTVLTAAQLQNQSRAFRPIFTSGIGMWYPLLTFADRLHDYSGNGTTLTASAVNPTTDVGAPASWNF